MSNPYFRFKEFIVYHDKCAMKVGTDGVLLGAWVDLKEVNSALDIGTGSGLISLMLAQRSESLHIDAVEIDDSAYKQAKENVERSAFSDRICPVLCDFQSFGKRVPLKKYDLIVSNPPYFSDSLKPSVSERKTARHTDTLSMGELIGNTAGLLTPNGKFNLIYPTDCLDEIIEKGRNYNLFVSRICHVLPRKNLPSKRVLIEMGFLHKPTEETKLIIEIDRHVYTPEFRSLTKDFYLEK